MFNTIKELTLVDWETLSVFTCVNPKCNPALNGDFYTEEFGYVAFSPDFEKVKLGTEEEIMKQMKEKRKMLQ